MLALQIDSTSDFDVRLPTASTELLELGVAYLARENSLPAEARCPVPRLEVLRDCLDRAKAAVRDAETHEADRAESSAGREKALDEAIPLLDKAINRLKVLHEDNLAALERWGLSTKVIKGGRISVAKPKGRLDWVQFLTRYVEREQAQPAEARLPIPPLATLAALDEAIRTGRAVRDEGRTARAAAIQRRNEALAELRDLLQMAVVVLTMEKFGHKLSRDLAQWGFSVIARIPKAAIDPGQPAKPGSEEE